MFRTTFSNRNLSSTEKALINNATNASDRHRITLCEVGNKSLPGGDGNRTTLPLAQATGSVIGGDHRVAVLIADNNPLPSFHLDFDIVNGLLDIYVYTLDQSLPHADIRRASNLDRASDVELMTNITVRIKDGEAIAAWEEGSAGTKWMAMYGEAVAEVTGGDE
jgi:hypothetical protein